MIENEKAEINPVKIIMGLFIAAILTASLLPTSLNSVAGGRNGSWVNTTATGLLSAYDSIAILIVVVILAIFAAIAYKSFND